ncbi:unnamed protein product [Closterium sp. NIES-53]
MGPDESALLIIVSFSRKGMLGGLLMTTFPAKRENVIEIRTPVFSSFIYLHVQTLALIRIYQRLAAKPGSVDTTGASMQCCQIDTLRAARKRSRDQDDSLRHGGFSSSAKRGAEHARMAFAESSSCLQPQILRNPSIKSHTDTQDQDQDQHDASRRLHASGDQEQPHQSMDFAWTGSQLHQRRGGSGFQENRPETPGGRPETPGSRPETPANRPGSGGGGGKHLDCHVDGKKVRVVQYPYKPLLPRDGFSWVKYGQKKLTTGDNMIRLYFQCGLRTSHACPARRTVDLSCWDPSVPLCLNYHSTHSHTPHYPAAGAGATATNTSPAPLPKVRSVKDRSVRARGSAPVTAAAAAGAAGAAAVDRSPLSKRAAVKEEATETNGGAGRTLQCPPSCLPALASTPVSGATWKDTSVPAPSRPSSNACSPSPHAPASAVADWRAALEALLNGSALPASAPTPAPASSDEPAHARPSTVPSSGSCAAAAAAPLQAQLQPLPVDLLAALVLLVQSALAEGGLAGAEEAVPTAEGMPRQQQQHEQQQQQQQHEQQQQQQHEQLQQQHEQQEELPGLEDTDCPLSSAPLTPALSDPTNCPQQSFGTSENTDDAEFFQEMSPGGDDTAADALAAAAESHLVNWEESGDAGADLLGDSLTWPSDSWPNASQLLALEHCMNTAAWIEAPSLFPCQDSYNSLQAASAGALVSDLTQRARVWSVGAKPSMIQLLKVLREQGVLLTVLLGLSAFFSMAETSITTLWPWKVRELAEKEKEGSVFQLLRRDVTRFLTTILIGTTLVNIWATALVTDAATALFGEAGVSAATGVMTILLLVFTEIAPKSIAVHNATQVVRVVLRPVAWLSVVLYPVGRLCTYASTGLFRLLGLKTSGEPFVTEEELKLMLRGAEMSGAIEEEEQDMIENVLEIKDTYVREVMTPLVDVVAVGSSASLMELRALWVRHQYSRVPVYERRVDNIVGIAYAMDMLDYVEQPELLHRLSVGRIAHRPAYFVPDSMSVWNLLREFRIRKVHMAIVLNEYGGTVGLVTLEDAVEEIVGEIFDENDSKEEIRRKTGYIIQRAEGVYDVDANTTVDDLADILQVVLPPRASFYETVSGFVCEAFGYIPRTGDTKIIRLQRKESEEEEEGEGAEEGGAGGTFTLPALLPLILSPGWQILSGNARKVVAVRFEELKETEGASGGGVKGKLGAGKEEEDIEKETERKREKDRERALVEEWESEKRREGRRKERISQEVRSRGLGEVGRGEGEGTGEGESKCETCEQMKLGRGKAGGRGVLLDSESEGEEGEVLMGGGWLTSGDGEEGGYSEVVYTDSDMGERDGVGESGSDMGSGTEIEGESVRRGEGGEFDGVESGGVGGEEEEDQDLFGEELEGADERRVGELRGVLHQEQQQAASAGADGPGTERGEAGAGTTTSYSTSSSSSMMSSSSSMITTGSTGVECDSPGSSNGSSLVRGAAWREEAVTWRTEEEEEDSDYSSGSDGLVGLNGGAGGKGGGVREFEGVAMAQEQYERWEEKEKQVERRRQRRKRERSEAQAELRRQALGIGGGGDAATQLSPHTEPLRLRLSRPDAVSESERE